MTGQQLLEALQALTPEQLSLTVKTYEGEIAGIGVSGTHEPFIGII